jgi:hypothetical protein
VQVDELIEVTSAATRLSNFDDDSFLAGLEILATCPAANFNRRPP